MVLRPAEPGDAMAVARVHVRSWQVGYRTLMPDEYLDGLRPEDRAPHYNFTHTDPAAPFTTVALEGAVVVGFATTGPAREASDLEAGELFALYVDPAFWSRGVGTSLLAAACARLAQRFVRASLWVLETNLRSRRFYEARGWSPDGGSRTDSIWDITVESMRYRRPLP